MKLFILGFQRLVWCPKWTPASIISRMVMGESVEGWTSSDAGEGDDDEVSVDSILRLLCVVSSASVIGNRNSGAAPKANGKGSWQEHARSSRQACGV
jgi:hypothetical protein